MVHCHGQRHATRHKFAKAKRGAPHLARYLTIFKKGDYADIKVDGSVHRGMPQSYQHGKTGRIFDIRTKSLGVVVNKRVGGKIFRKRIQVRIEHLRLSRCKEETVQRTQRNAKYITECKKSGKPIDRELLKRKIAGPRDGHIFMPKSEILQKPDATLEEEKQ